MKKEIPKELIELGEEMRTQDNRATANVMFAIEVDVKEYIDGGRYGERDWEFVERRSSVYGVDEKSYCLKCREIKYEEDLPEDCSDCDDECFFFYNIERGLHHDGNVFLTAEACERHIQQNHYHYANPKSYGICAWRNPEMESVIKFLKSL